MSKRSIICITALFTAPLLLTAAPALAGFKAGEYTVTFYSGPSHTASASQCIVFTDTGAVSGFRDGGTFDSSTLGGWGGNYVYDTGYLRIYSTASGGAEAVNGYIRMSKMAGGFDDWAARGPLLTGLSSASTPSSVASRHLLPRQREERSKRERMERSGSE